MAVWKKERESYFVGYQKWMEQFPFWKKKKESLDLGLGLGYTSPAAAVGLGSCQYVYAVARSRGHCIDARPLVDGRVGCGKFEMASRDNATRRARTNHAACRRSARMSSGSIEIQKSRNLEIRETGRSHWSRPTVRQCPHG